MVAPSGVGDVDRCGLVGLEEGGDDREGAGAGEGLAGGDEAVGDEGGVFAEGDFAGGEAEVWSAVDWRVLLFELGFNDELLNFADDWEDVGLSCFISVGADTEVDFVLVCVLLVSSGEGKNWIWGVNWDVGPLVNVSRKMVVQGCKSLHLLIMLRHSF